MAIVRFEIADDIITRIKKTERMTFADFLSNIGKYFQRSKFFQNRDSDQSLFCLQEENWDCLLASVY